VRLKDKVALVTGASRGIGRAIALTYAREGALVALNYNATPDGAHQAVDEIRGAGGHAEAFAGDVGDTEHMKSLFARVNERFGRLDVYVNNANAGRYAPRGRPEYLETSEDQLFNGFYLSVKAAFMNGQLAARQMISQGSGGVIINITSVHQERAWLHDSVYGSMKAAIRRLTMSQARELGAYNIRVNAIAPGFIDIRAFPGERGEQYDRFNEIVLDQVPLGRGVPSDIAGAALYLASDDSRYVTGTYILVDGGMLVSPEATV
jgi:NAD(P)-dependent dehydrogenase (short-subunit alcohol dehydrogenase family)